MFDIPTQEETTRIQAGIAADPDTFELSDGQISRLRPLRPLGRPKAALAKQAVSIRLSQDVLAYFKADGRGWQTRLNAVLEAYVSEHR